MCPVKNHQNKSLSCHERKPYQGEVSTASRVSELPVPHAIEEFSDDIPCFLNSKAKKQSNHSDVVPLSKGKSGRPILKNPYRVSTACLEDVECLVEMQMSLQKHMLTKNPALWDYNKAELHRLKDFYLERLADDNSKLIVMKIAESGNIVATALGKINYHDGYVPDRSGEVDGIWVDYHHRRRGLCKHMVAVLIEFFESSNIEYLVLKYAQGNEEAMSVWKYFGFKPVLVTATTNVGTVKEALYGHGTLLDP